MPANATRVSALRRLVFLLFVLSAPGCRSAMNSHPQPPPASNGIVQNELPLRFESHVFRTICYSTYGCRVLYNNSYSILHEPDQFAPPYQGEVEKKYWENGGELGIDNFPRPAVVIWRSRDGVAHEAVVDIGEIFKDQRVLHNVPDAELPTETIAMPAEPYIYLVVDDRTISVYMQATIALKEPRIPGNPYSNFRDDVILAYSRTY